MPHTQLADFRMHRVSSGDGAGAIVFVVASQLPTIWVPTLVTWGDRDTVIPFDAIVEVFTSIAGCALEVWHGVGHSGPIEIPVRFVALLTRFIEEAGQG